MMNGAGVSVENLPVVQPPIHYSKRFEKMLIGWNVLPVKRN
jgi:hypothetical protein